MSRTNFMRQLEEAPTEESKLIDSVWLACAVDSEGSLGLYDIGHDGRRLDICVTNKNMEFILNARRIFGAGSIYTRKAHGNKKECYAVHLHGHRVVPIIERLLPFLIVKREKALKILNVLEERPLGQHSSNGRMTISLMMQKRWENPEYRAKMTQISKEPRYFTPEQRKAMSDRMKMMRNNGMMKWNDETKKKVSEKFKARWRDPAYREHATKAMMHEKKSHAEGGGEVLP